LRARANLPHSHLTAGPHTPAILFQSKSIRMPSFMTFLVRLFLVAAGLLFAASMAVAAVLMLALLGIRAVWAKLTGRPVVPFIIRINPRSGFERMYRRAEPGSPTPRADAEQPGRRAGDVTDVEPKAPRG
jgi:hypothetical protein